MFIKITETEHPIMEEESDFYVYVSLSKNSTRIMRSETNQFSEPHLARLVLSYLKIFPQGGINNSTQQPVVASSHLS